jgi:hypothetical protein
MREEDATEAGSTDRSSRASVGGPPEVVGKGTGFPRLRIFVLHFAISSWSSASSSDGGGHVDWRR